MKKIIALAVGFVVLVAVVTPFILRWSIVTAFGVDLPPITPVAWLAYNVLVSVPTVLWSITDTLTSC